MRSDNVHDLSSLDIAFRLGNLQKMHYIQDLRVESFLLRHDIWFRYRSSDLSVRELCKSFFEIGPDDILRFEEEYFLSVSYLFMTWSISLPSRRRIYQVSSIPKHKGWTYRVTSSTEAYWPGEVLRILSNSSQHPSSASHASLTCAALTALRRFATGPVSARLIRRQASYFVSVQ
jgi:hypothetical protein